jgi:membrane protease YdiL (CAAX protease family)
MSKLEAEGLLATILCAAVVPGICEEMLCRGTLLSGLSGSVGKVGAVILSAFLFATLHLVPYRFLPQFTLGIFLAMLTVRARSILPGMLLHAGHNTGLILLSLISGSWLAQFIGIDLAPAGAGPALVHLALGLLGVALLVAPTRTTAPMSLTQHT